MRKALCIILLLAMPLILFAQIQPAQPAQPTDKTGKNNSIIDVPGIEVGNYTDPKMTGTTVVLCRKGGVGAVSVMGSAPGTRETDLLDPINLVDRVNAVVLTGGSAYGLAAADGVMLWLEEKGLGWPVGGGNVVPIGSGRSSSIRAALAGPSRSGPPAFGIKPARTRRPLPSEGTWSRAARSPGLKGGLGNRHVDLGNGVIVGAIVAVKFGGSTVNPLYGRVLRLVSRVGNEFGDLRRPFP
jgi:L-aminopeptidase/D-esterase-like protein